MIYAKMPGPESRSSEPHNEQENIYLRRKYFRQVVALARIFLKLRKNDPQKYDPDLNRSLLDSTETKTHFENEQRESRTWLGELEDGSVEVVTEARVYTTLPGSVTRYENPSQALGALIEAHEASEAARTADPLSYFANKISNQTTLSRSRRSTLLRPRGKSGEVVTEYQYEVFNDHDELTELETGPVVQQVDAAGHGEELGSLRIKFVQELRRLLNSATLGEHAEQIARLFTPELRQKILSLALSEIRIAHEAGRLSLGSNMVQVDGGADFIHDHIYPVVHYHVFQFSLTPDQKIKFRQIILSQFVKDSIMANDDRLKTEPVEEAKPTQYRAVKSQTHAGVSDWKAELVKEIGPEGATALLLQEALDLHEDVFLNAGSVSGITKEMVLDPASGQYTYRYGRRILEGSVFNATNAVYLDTHAGNPEDPSLDELEALLLLAF